MSHRSLRVCVFCGSLEGNDPRFAGAAVELGAGLATAGHEVIYGGSASGCMGLLADAVLGAGGRIVGVFPGHVMPSERLHTGLSELETVSDLATRKLRMFSRSDVVLVLPGGTGTLDELIEALTLKRLGVIEHRIIVINVVGFFAPLLGLLDHLAQTGFAGAAQRQLIEVVPDVGSALAHLSLA